MGEQYDYYNLYHAVYLDAEYRTMKDYVFKCMAERAVARFAGQSWRGAKAAGKKDGLVEFLFPGIFDLAAKMPTETYH